MTIKPLLALTLLLFSVAAFPQAMTTKDGKQYPATENWDFICENYALTGTAKIQVARTEKGGLLQITAQTTDPSYFIGGVVYVYLDDNTIIVCTDKNQRLTKDNETTAWYAFSAIEMEKLKKTNIESVRFNIRGNPKKFGSQIGNFTAANKKTYFSIRENKPAQFETASEIGALYK